MQKQQMDDNANKVHEKKIKTVSLSFNRTLSDRDNKRLYKSGKKTKKLEITRKIIYNIIYIQCY